MSRREQELAAIADFISRQGATPCGSGFADVAMTDVLSLEEERDRIRQLQLKAGAEIGLRLAVARWYRKVGWVRHR